jgi:hypothetical protein
VLLKHVFWARIFWLREGGGRETETLVVEVNEGNSKENPQTAKNAASGSGG